MEFLSIFVTEGSSLALLSAVGLEIKGPDNPQRNKQGLKYTGILDSTLSCTFGLKTEIYIDS